MSTILVKNINKAEPTANECVAEINSTQELLNNCSDIHILKSIVTKTQTITRTSHELKQELEQSSIEMDKLKSELETIAEVARTDSLTGLLNRGAFDIELRNLCIQSDINITLVLFAP